MTFFVGTVSNMVDWSQLYQHRKAVEKRFGDLWQLPIKKRYYSALEALDHSQLTGEAPLRVLEIGAGSRKLENRLKQFWTGVDYKSCDIDPSYPHDFKHVSEVTGEYDVICLFEIIEHVTIEQADEMLTACKSLLTPGGHIVISTPNIYYPPAYLRDVTHITAWCYDELGGFLSLCGFEVDQVYRIYHDSMFKRLVRRYLFYPIFRVLNIDFARQIVVVAKQPVQPQPVPSLPVQ